MIMDYKEEQNGEIEALDSIYYGDLRVIDVEPYHKFSIPIKSEEFEPDTDNGLSCLLTFTYTSKYPDEPPEICIEEVENIEKDDEDALGEFLSQQAKDNLGMVMIFTLVSAGQEWLNEKWDKIKKDREEGRLMKLQAEEEAEMKRFEGTRVTVETFLKWKTQFEQDMGISKRREKEEREGKKLTGKELFLKDATLNESDLKFLDDGSTAVKVDESLFQDLDDLDIDDEDDEDFDPDNYDSDDS